MTTDGTLRRPTDHEQAIIASVYEVRSRVETKALPVVGVGMGRNVIEDEARGRWVTLLGLPVREIKDDPDALVLLVDARIKAVPA